MSLFQRQTLWRARMVGGWAFASSRMEVASRWPSSKSTSSGVFQNFFPELPCTDDIFFFCARCTVLSSVFLLQQTIPLFSTRRSPVLERLEDCWTWVSFAACLLLVFLAESYFTNLQTASFFNLKIKPEVAFARLNSQYAFFWKNLGLWCSNVKYHDHSFFTTYWGVPNNPLLNVLIRQGSMVSWYDFKMDFHSESLRHTNQSGSMV